MDSLLGTNCIVLDLETLRSSDSCKHCFLERERHQGEHIFEKLGWDNKLALGLSIGCYFDYADGQLHWFDMHTIEDTMQLFVERQSLLVSFNGVSFDFALMRALVREKARWYSAPEGGVDTQEASRLTVLCDTFKTLCASSYDILAKIWEVDSARKFERGLNSLDAICRAMGLPAKEMDGATAPRLWAQGRHAEVIGYNVGDVLRTKALFEHLMEHGTVIRGDGNPLQIHPPLDFPLLPELRPYVQAGAGEAASQL